MIFYPSCINFMPLWLKYIYFWYQANTFIKNERIIQSRKYNLIFRLFCIVVKQCSVCFASLRGAKVCLVSQICLWKRDLSNAFSGISQQIFCLFLCLVSQICLWKLDLSNCVKTWFVKCFHTDFSTNHLCFSLVRQWIWKNDCKILIVSAILSFSSCTS